MAIQYNSICYQNGKLRSGAAFIAGKVSVDEQPSQWLHLLG
jgi:hypothetical protein